MFSKATELLTINSINEIKDIISKNDGNEVAFVGNISKDGLVSDIIPLAYGNENSAPVVIMDALQGDVLIHNHPGEENIKILLRPSDSDISLASVLANQKIGFYIIDNQCEWVNIINKPEPRYYLKEDEILSIFKSGGLLEKNIPHFESREEQISLVTKIIETINESKILLSEAGTGTGKSLSYLIPVSIWAIMNKKRVIISTHTKNLQQQIFHKDMLIVEKIIKNYVSENKPFSYSILIGRNNYLCKKKLLDLINDNEKRESLFENEDIENLMLIEEWSRTTEEGIISEADIKIKEELREEISSDAESCLRKKCDFYNNCFYYKARLEAEKSNIIIVNHSLVFSSIDEESKRISLPFFSGIVLDEAHNVEETALKSLAKDFSIQSILYHLRKIFNKKGEKEIGFLPLLKKKASINYPEFDEFYKSLVSIINEIFHMLNNFLKSAHNEEQKKTIIIDDQFFNSKYNASIFIPLEEILKTINKFIGFFEDFKDFVKKNATNPSVEEYINYLSYRIRRLEEIEIIFNLIFKTENEINHVKWIEISKKNVKFCFSPLEVEDFLANSIFSKKDFTIFTSATLTVGEKFEFFKNSIGLPLVTNKENVEIILPSPFNYEKQALILILDKHLNHNETTKEKINLIKELTLISEGGVLILYTSSQRMNENYELIKEDLVKAGLLFAKQENHNKNSVLKKMRENKNFVLFATQSFWEGIDIKGNNLRMVIIEKLPFDSMEDPLYNAKVKLLDFKGLNPFITYSLPRAILKLKQGMGRLIRSKTDKGVIVILDSRIINKTYGKTIIKSLPKCQIITGDEKTLIIECENFFINNFTTL